MKRFKKMLSLLLVGVIVVTSLFCGTVTASAFEIDPDICSYYERSGDSIFIYICGLSKEKLNGIMDNSDYGIILILNGNFEGVDTVHIEASSSTLFHENEPLIINRIFINNTEYNGAKIKKSGFEKEKTGYKYVFEISNDDKLFECIKKITDLGSRRHSVFISGGSIGKKKYYNDKEIISIYFFNNSSKKFNIDNSDINIISNDEIYTGSALTKRVFSLSMKEDTDYTVSYKNNKEIGTATITITGKGYYTDKKEFTFKIVPPQTTLTVKKSGGKYKLSWKAVEGGITKYQIQYSSDGGKTFKNAGTVSAKKTSTSLKLDTSKSYTFRIRSYKTVDGKKYYSAWSKTVKTK